MARQCEWCLPGLGTSGSKLDAERRALVSSFFPNHHHPSCHAPFVPTAIHCKLIESNEHVLWSSPDELHVQWSPQSSTAGPEFARVVQTKSGARTPRGPPTAKPGSGRVVWYVSARFIKFRQCAQRGNSQNAYHPGHSPSNTSRACLSSVLSSLTPHYINYVLQISSLK